MSVRTTTRALPWLMLMIAVGGCSSLQDCQSDWALKHRAKAVYKHTGCHLPYGAARHYERGWMMGYCDVAKGGNGSPPPLPPQAYWGFKYQNAEGQAAVETWFQGYHDGAAMAQADGVQQYNYLPSPHLGAPVYQTLPNGGAMLSAAASAVKSPSSPTAPAAAQVAQAAAAAPLNRDFPVRLPSVSPVASVAPTGPATPVLETIQQTSATSALTNP